MARFRALLSWAAPYVSTFLVLCLLAVVGYVGWRMEWKLSFSSKKAEEEAKSSEGDSTPGRVKLASEEAVKNAGIETAPVEVREMSHEITAPGEIEFDPARYAQVAPRVAGTVWKVCKQVGDRVAAGDVLAIVESADVGKMKTDLLQALVMVDTRTKLLHRAQAGGSAVPESQLREAEAALREAKIRVLTQHQMLVNVGLPFNLDAVSRLNDEEAQRFLRTLGLPPALLCGPDVLSTNFLLDSLSANLLPVRAPFEGAILRRAAAHGETVTATQPLFVVADTRRVWLMLGVQRQHWSRIDPKGGQRVTFEVDADEDKPGAGSDEPPSGRVAWISPEIDEKSHTIRVRVPLENPNGQLRANLFGTGHIVLRENPYAVVVPNAALQREGDDYLVFVKVSETEFEARQVLVGARGPTHSEVLPPLVVVSTAGLLGTPGGPWLAAATLCPGRTVRWGVQPGEYVVTKGSHVLKSELDKDRIGGGD